ncbi:MAG: PD40 domain-containing protein [Chloroflexi bacterium]|nr:PD40 domain-containing protein [Chloroflexota bacterium]
MAAYRSVPTGGARRRVIRRRTLLLGALAAGSCLLWPAGTTLAHTCTPDATVAGSGRLLVPKASGVSVFELPGRMQRTIAITPAQGVATAVAASRDGSLLAVPRFWRPPADRVGGQDILLVGPGGGAPIGTLPRSRPGEALGSPSWLPDGSLVYERRVLSGTNEIVQIERAAPGGTAQVLAEDASSPSTSPDGALLALVRFAGTDRLSVMTVGGGPEHVIVDQPQLLSIAFPRFSPDGTWIAFTAASDPGVAAEERPDLPADTPPTDRPTGSGVHPRVGYRLPLLTDTPPPIGARTVRAHGVPWDVWVVRPDGSELRQVTTFADDDSSVTWSPDGQHLATFSAEAMHVVSVDGAASYCLAGEGGYGGIEWLP